MHGTLWNAIFTSLIGQQHSIAVDLSAKLTQNNSLPAVKKSMLSVHYVSIMMRIFYMDWQQHWEYDRTMNIGANAHGKRTVSTKQPQVTDLTSVSPLTVGPPVTSERYWACFQVTRLFHSATICFCCYICICWLKLHRADYQIEEFFYLDLVGEHSAPVYFLFAPYTDL